MHTRSFPYTTVSQVHIALYIYTTHSLKIIRYVIGICQSDNKHRNILSADLLYCCEALVVPISHLSNQ